MSQLRFFIDHCVPMSMARFLRDLGHDVFLLRACIPKDSPDPVLKYREKKILKTSEYSGFK